jgi:hypothetical protein
LEIESLSTSANRPNRAIKEYRLRGLRRRRPGSENGLHLLTGVGVFAGWLVVADA